MEPNGNYPERAVTPDGAGTVDDYGGGAGNTPPYIHVGLDDGKTWTGSPRECDPA